MAAWKLLTPGIILGCLSTILLVLAISTDYWYVIDARLYLKVCPEARVFGPALPWPFTSTKLATSFHDSSKADSVSNPAPLSQSKDGNSIYSSDIDCFNTFGNAMKAFAHHYNRNKVKTVAVEAPLIERRSSYFGKRNKLHKKYSNLRLNSYSNQQEKVSKKKFMNNWNKLMISLSQNLNIFGGRDITVRQTNFQEKNTENVNNQTYSEMDRNKVDECSRRQFSTVTGLWRTCYHPDADSMLQKSISCGSLKRCAPISYDNVDATKFPPQLRLREKLKIQRDELTLIHVRRAIVSFFFLGLLLQVFGLLVVSLGWYKEECLTQHSGGLVLLMSGVFQLSGLCGYIILSNTEITRRPRDVFNLPALILHGYGQSAYAAWGSFGGTLLASFLCVMAPQHRPAFPQFSCRSNLVQCRNKKYCGDPRSSSVEDGKRTSGAASPHPDQLQVSVQKREEQIEKPNTASRAITLSKSKSGNCMPRSGADTSPKYNRTLSPVATVRTPKAAIKALEAENNETFSLRSKLTNPLRSNDGVSNQHRYLKKHSDTLNYLPHQARNLDRRKDVELKNYIRKTRSLPRQLPAPKMKLNPTLTTTSISRDADATTPRKRTKLVFDSGTSRMQPTVTTSRC